METINNQEETPLTREELEAIYLKRQEALVFRFQTGTLSYEEFRQLPRLNRKNYARKYGRPKSPDEQRGVDRRIAKVRAAKKNARKSRRAARV